MYPLNAEPDWDNPWSEPEFFYLSPYDGTTLCTHPDKWVRKDYECWCEWAEDEPELAEKDPYPIECLYPPVFHGPYPSTR